MEEQVQQNTIAITNLQNKLDLLQANLDTINAQISTLSDSVDTLEEQIGSGGGGGGGSGAEIASLKAQIESLKAIAFLFD